MVNQKLILFSIQWESLLKPEIWLDAATQIFFSLSLGFGALVAFASYNPINNNIIRDSYIIVLTDCATAVFGGVVVFSILGFREHVTGIPVTEVSFRRGGRFLYSYSKRGCTKVILLLYWLLYTRDTSYKTSKILSSVKNYQQKFRTCSEYSIFQKLHKRYKIIRRVYVSGSVV